MIEITRLRRSVSDMEDASSINHIGRFWLADNSAMMATNLLAWTYPESVETNALQKKDRIQCKTPPEPRTLLGWGLWQTNSAP